MLCPGQVISSLSRNKDPSKRVSMRQTLRQSMSDLTSKSDAQVLSELSVWSILRLPLTLVSPDLILAHMSSNWAVTLRGAMASYSSGTAPMIENEIVKQNSKNIQGQKFYEQSGILRQGEDFRDE